MSDLSPIQKRRSHTPDIKKQGKNIQPFNLTLLIFTQKITINQGSLSTLRFSALSVQTIFSCYPRFVYICFLQSLYVLGLETFLNKYNLMEKAAVQQQSFHAAYVPFFPLLFTRADVPIGFLRNKCRLFIAGHDNPKISLS